MKVAVTRDRAIAQVLLNWQTRKMRRGRELDIEAPHPSFPLAINEFRTLVQELTSGRNKRFVAPVEPILLEEGDTVTVLEGQLHATMIL